MGMSDEYYADFAVDYHWLAPDEALVPPGQLGVTSRGNGALIRRALGGLPPDARILDCACGIGLDSMALACAGYQVTATDGSEAMITQARKRFADAGVAVPTSQCLWEDLPRTVPGPYSAVLCLGNSLMHAGSRDGMIRALTGMRAVLTPDGALVVDSRNWEWLHRERPRVVTAPRIHRRDEVRGSAVYVWSIPETLGDPCRAEIIVLLEAPDGSLTHRRHVIDYHPFRHTDLIECITAAGLTVCDSSYTEDQPFYAIAATRG
jgi:glycine/sarcosine N-methyltransferase